MGSSRPESQKNPQDGSGEAKALHLSEQKKTDKDVCWVMIFFYLCKFDLFWVNVLFQVQTNKKNIYSTQ